MVENAPASSLLSLAPPEHRSAETIKEEWRSLSPLLFVASPERAEKGTTPLHGERTQPQLQNPGRRNRFFSSLSTSPGTVMSGKDAPKLCIRFIRAAGVLEIHLCCRRCYDRNCSKDFSLIGVSGDY
ncbi:uncharacterized protein LOC116266926 [Nymphaea colorata]|uniref:uncharacterized protein LOC116266926 n=1 Tax=Nymphaea colorata TaxID=210225 RepID=UPI00129E6412|nr:uncharacterized protein LOC116266926 [Nymphaea colorata]